MRFSGVTEISKKGGAGGAKQKYQNILFAFLRFIYVCSQIVPTKKSRYCFGHTIFSNKNNIL